MKLRTVLSICLILLAFQGIAQSNEEWSDTVWLINGKKELRHPFKKWKPELQFDGRFSVIANTRMQIGGLRLGLEHKRIHRFGFGVFNWSTGFVTGDVNLDVSNVAELRSNTAYVTLYYERVLFFSRKWEVASTIHLGSGQIETSYRLEGENEYRSLEPTDVFPLEVSSSGFFHFTWWLSVGGGFGYRYMRNSPEEVRELYSAPVYIAKAKIRLGKLVRRIGNPDVKDEY